MLVLTRKMGESIVIGREVVVTVVRIRANKVRLGITAREEVPIHRREVQQTIDDESLGTFTEQSESPTARELPSRNCHA